MVLLSPAPFSQCHLLGRWFYRTDPTPCLATDPAGRHSHSLRLPKCHPCFGFTWLTVIKICRATLLLEHIGSVCVSHWMSDMTCFRHLVDSCGLFFKKWCNLASCRSFGVFENGFLVWVRHRIQGYPGTFPLVAPILLPRAR